MKCPTCGQIIRTEREFCALCGTPLKKKKSHGGLIAVIVILALIVAGLAFYRFYWKDRTASKPQETVIVQAEEGGMAREGEEIRIDESSQAEPTAVREDLLFSDGVEIYAMPSYSLVLRQDGSVAVAGRSASPEFGFDLFDWTGICQVLPTDFFVAGLTEEGRVRLTGEVSGYEEAARWTDVARLYFDADLLYGLTRDGHVLAVGPGADYDYAALTDIVDILPGGTDTLAVSSDGRVTVMRHYGGLWDAANLYDMKEVAIGPDVCMYLMQDGTVHTTSSVYRVLELYGWENPYYFWSDMKKLLVGNGFIAGLKQDGSVACQAYLPMVQAPDTSAWTGVEQIVLDTERGILYGVTAQGRILAASGEGSPDLPISTWENVQELQINGSCWVALTKDGRVLTAAYPEQASNLETEDWENVKAISLSSGHLLGLLDDGSVLAVGDNSAGQCG